MHKSYRKRQVLSLGLLAGLAGTVVEQAVAASAPPVFSPTAQTAWVGIGIGALLPVPGSPKPIGQDPAHRYISNDESRVTGQQPTQRVSDINNPNLKQMRERRDEEGQRRSACRQVRLHGALLMQACRRSGLRRAARGRSVHSAVTYESH